MRCMFKSSRYLEFNLYCFVFLWYIYGSWFMAKKSNNHNVDLLVTWKEEAHSVHSSVMYLNESLVNYETMKWSLTSFDYFLLADCISIYPLQLVYNNSFLSTHANFSLDFKRWLNWKYRFHALVIRMLIYVCVSRLLSVNIYLTLKTINLQTVQHHELPDCYDFHIMVGDKLPHLDLSF